jgi:hypothetical protein
MCETNLQQTGKAQNAVVLETVWVLVITLCKLVFIEWIMVARIIEFSVNKFSMYITSINVLLFLVV